MDTKLYPIVDGHRHLYVQFPLQITEEVISSVAKQDLPLAELFKVGWFIAVDVLLPTGYRIPPNGVPIENEALCKKGCAVHNHYCGYSLADVENIISQSMGLTTEDEIWFEAHGMHATASGGSHREEDIDFSFCLEIKDGHIVGAYSFRSAYNYIKHDYEGVPDGEKVIRYNDPTLFFGTMVALYEVTTDSEFGQKLLEAYPKEE